MCAAHNPDSLKPSVGHDHGVCIQTALSRAESVCVAAGSRLTSTRRRVLELIWSSHQPLGAYELMDRLAAEGQRPAPPTVYRALEFLQSHGLVHRIATRNAFTGCSAAGTAHRGVFLICRQCGNAEEVSRAPNLDAALTALYEQAGFTPETESLELTGLCQACRV